MTVEHLIAKIKHDQPMAVYLGRIHMEGMRQAAEAAGVYTNFRTPEPDLHRLEIHGVPLYLVDSENHIGFSGEVLLT